MFVIVFVVKLYFFSYKVELQQNTSGSGCSDVMIGRPQKHDWLSVCSCVPQKADDREKRQEAHRFHFDAMWRSSAAPRERLTPDPPPHPDTQFDPHSFQGPINWYSCALKRFFFSFLYPFQSMSRMWNIYVPFDLFIPVLEARPDGEHCGGLKQRLLGTDSTEICVCT